MLGRPEAKVSRPNLTNLTTGVGLDMDQFGTMSSAFPKAKTDLTWQRYLSAAKSQWNNGDDALRRRMRLLGFIYEQDGQNYWDEAGNTPNINSKSSGWFIDKVEAFRPFKYVNYFK